MRAVPSIPITSAELTYSSVAEPHSTEQVYNAVKAYANEDRVISVTTHRTYESISGTKDVVNFTIANPGTVNWANHDLTQNTPVAFSTTGVLPTGITAGAIYYVIAPTADTFQISSTKDGTAITFFGTQSGVNTGIANPNVNRALDNQEWWVDVGPTVRYAMFDLYRNTGTTDDSPLTVTIAPGRRIDSLILTGLNAASVDVTVRVGDPSEIAYSYSKILTTREVTNWYQYFFEPFSFQNTVQLFDIPPYISTEITIVLTRADGEVSCDGVVIGNAVYMGNGEYGGVSDTLNFSTFTRDELTTEVTLIPRRNVPTVDLTVRAPKELTNILRKLRDDSNAAPVFWSGVDDPTHDYFEAVSLLAVYKRFAIRLDQPNHVEVDLQLEGF